MASTSYSAVEVLTCLILTLATQDQAEKREATFRAIGYISLSFEI